MRLPAFAGKYVGLPFKPDGHSFDGVKCWGLVYLVLREEAHIEVSPYGSLTAAQLLAVAHEATHARCAPPWIEVSAPQLFDVVLMTAMVADAARNLPRRAPAHFGIMLTPKIVLHIWEETNSMLMPLDHPRIANHVLGFYRHEALA